MTVDVSIPDDDGTTEQLDEVYGTDAAAPELAFAAAAARRAFEASDW